MADISADVVKKFRDHENRIERLEKIESLSLSDELAHTLGAGIAASAGVALDASRHDHIHEITASDNPGGKVSLLQTDINGHLTVVQLNTTANHTTTTLTDHIGEHTASHGVVVDNDLHTSAHNYYSTSAALTASTTHTQAGALGLTKHFNQIGTAVSDNDCVRLPTAAAGLQIFVINYAANHVAVWPASGDAINLDAVNAVSSLTIENRKTHMFVAYGDTYWAQTLLG